jgi:hypothetical protein
VGSSPHTPNKQVTKLGYAADENELQDDMDGNSVIILEELNICSVMKIPFLFI